MDANASPSNAVAPQKHDEGRGDPALPPASAGSPAWGAVVRAVALFFGAFSLLTVWDVARHPAAPAAQLVRFGADFWWLEVPLCPAWAARGLLGGTGVLLLLFAVRPNLPLWARRLAVAAVLILFASSLWETFAYYLQFRQGLIRTDFPVPFSLHVAASWAVILAGLVSPSPPSRRTGRDLLLGSFTLAVCAASLPLAHIHCFGETGTGRSADAALVIGNVSVIIGDEASGAPSWHEALRTACRLHESRRIDQVIVGTADNAIDAPRPAILRRTARQLGIPDDHLLLVSAETSPEAIVRETAALCEVHGFDTLLIVGPFHQLARIQLACRREGVQAFTIPAERRSGGGDRWSLLQREVFALWWCYLRPLVSRDQPE